MKKFSISGRFNALEQMDLINSIQTRFEKFKALGTIESIFGCYISYSKLYGGRHNANILDTDCIELIYSIGAHVSITMSNLFFDGKLDKNSEKILDLLHTDGNSIVVANDELAKTIRKYYPKYLLRASATKLITTIEEIDHLLELYNLVVLMPNYSTDIVFLEKIKFKDRIVLFANANCAYTCKNHPCYVSISRQNRGESNDDYPTCPMKDRSIRRNIKTTYFDMSDPIFNEFNNFKLVNCK